MIRICLFVVLCLKKHLLASYLIDQCYNVFKKSIYFCLSSIILVYTLKHYVNNLGCFYQTLMQFSLLIALRI
jgi:hypothetical protein